MGKYFAVKTVDVTMPSRPLAGMEMRGPGAESTPRAFELDGILLHFLARI
jgi:hypothetical protein